MVDALLQDLRYAARLFRRNPLFTLAASVSLALGIGVNAAVFSVAQAALLRSWPAREPDRLIADRGDHTAEPGFEVLVSGLPGSRRRDPGAPRSAGLFAPRENLAHRISSRVGTGRPGIAELL